jgi:hypothetical protein
VVGERRESLHLLDFVALLPARLLCGLHCGLFILLHEHGGEGRCEPAEDRDTDEHEDRGRDPTTGRVRVGVAVAHRQYRHEGPPEGIVRPMGGGVGVPCLGPPHGDGRQQRDHHGKRRDPAQTVAGEHAPRLPGGGGGVVPVEGSAAPR